MQPVLRCGLLLFIGILISLTACAADPSTPADNPDSGSDTASTNSSEANTTSEVLAEALENAPVPEEGKTTVVGRAVSEETGEPLTDTEIWLAEVHESDDGTSKAFAINEARSPFDFTDESGVFVMSNIEPDEYVLMIGSPYFQHYVIREEGNIDNARLWNLPPNEVYNIGEWYVTLEFS
jgi:hypothetical protein